MLFILCCAELHAQKVGLVFSGGGAKGLAHIGTLKALEENQIPIDYITGTSMGGIVGAMYAAGYSPKQIEQIAVSKEFQNWVNGRYTSDYTYYFQKNAPNASMLTAKVAIDTGFHFSFRSNIINDIPLNFAFLELFSQASAVSKDNFDNLFVPYRCMVADVLSQKSITVSKGSLAEAVRATMTVPIVYRPIKLDGKYVFDGGLYNNFPADVMEKEFKPDYVIGANVSSKTYNEYPKNIDDRLMNRFLVYMFLSKSDSTMIGKNGIYIQPDLGTYSVTNFAPVEDLIKKGYDATMADMPRIKALIAKRVDPLELERKRAAFNSRKPDLNFSNIIVSGVNSQQKKYVERLFKSDKATFNLEDIKRGYYKLVADQTFETIYPKISYQAVTDNYTFEVVAQPKKSFKLDLGGNISTRPISNVFLGAEYNYLNRKAYTFGTSFYSGRFYESVQVNGRIDYPTKLPIFLAAELTYNHWNFYNTSKIFIENPRPIYIEQSDRKIDLMMGVPLNYNTKVVLHANFINNNDRYSPNNTFSVGDLLDQTIFNGFRGSLNLEKNSLNRKQYATNGQSFSLSVNYTTGRENYNPGNISRNIPGFSKPIGVSRLRQWGSIKLTQENYFLHLNKYTLGYIVEGVISNQPLFSNYYSTLLVSPAFYPIQDSRSLFLDKFRATTYAAGGIKNIYNFRKNLDFRLEGYLFLPHKEFELNNFQDVDYAKAISKIRYAATAGVVYHTPVGPVSLSYNLYNDAIKRNGVLLHIGYLIYNKRSIE
ncbi:patatin-like phospholipase family protein [Pedobacter sp. MC2016-05]|uniref:patatin-like phospholipase family protein n=1 Tax=Pedobacter sp. MC2016-05 TaxID=2994474 RepID=UPI002247EEB0|nr:patatin-like phospholipase family protein [Pedobacter sp. MC2016-05]MCX2475598.1 patatin-like phospholipase family protein [Pedobacter sp. MC2016-05]